MIISAVIPAVCFVVIAFELSSVIIVFKKCRAVRCTVASSKKVSVRDEDFLIREYYKTEVSFTLDGDKRTAYLETSTFCQKGQVLGCYYYPKKDLVFRKRDIKNVLRSRSIPAFSVGVVFLLLNALFRMTSLGGIIVKYFMEALAILLIIPFTAFGIGFIIYSINAAAHTRKERVTNVEAKVVDIVRKTKRHRENRRYLYYPIYRYTLDGIEHTVTSKLGLEEPPAKGDAAMLLADKKKGGLVEFKDMECSFPLGVCFLLIALMLLCAVIFV